MEVSAQEEDQQHQTQQMILKGKRTKRQRPQSPIPFPIITDIACREGEGGDFGDENYAAATTAVFASPTSLIREEEEDMANCLILLAQGHSKEENTFPIRRVESSRREKGVGAGAGGGLISSYECKTCNRTFPSFQALGGHRASHRKLKPIAKIDEKKQIGLSSSDEEDSNLHKKKIMVSTFSLQLGSYKAMNNNTGNKSRSHECSICGAEFTSGQALGGHMRRHRGLILAGTVSDTVDATATTTANTALSLSPIAALEPEEVDNKPKKNNNGFYLDLNLPAPEDEHKENKFSFASKQPQQQAALVLSSTALVDCHY